MTEYLSGVDAFAILEFKFALHEAKYVSTIVLEFFIGGQGFAIDVPYPLLFWFLQYKFYVLRTYFRRFDAEGLFYFDLTIILDGAGCSYTDAFFYRCHERL